MFIELVRNEGDDGVHGYHEEDPNNVFLFPWLGVVRRMLEDEEEGDQGCDEGEDGG